MFVCISFPKGILLYMGETIKEIMYSVFPVVAMHRMVIDSFPLAISLNKYPYA